MDPEEKRKELEFEVLKIIEEKLSTGQMDLPRAKEIARMILDKLHPPLSLEQLYQIAPTLDDHFAELTRAVLPLMQENESQIREVVTKHAEQLLKSGKISEATAVIKQATQPQIV